MDLKRPLNWLKNKIEKIEENLNETVKTLSKATSIQNFLNVLYDLLLGVSATKRSVLGIM